MHVLMARLAEQQAVGRRPLPAVTAVLDVMDVQPGARRTGATAPVIASPDGRPYQALGDRACGAALAAHHDGGFRSREGRHVDHPRAAAIVRSAQMRTPGMGTEPLSARTAAANF